MEFATALLPLVFVLYLIVYAYGGYRVVSKFGFSINKALIMCGAMGVLVGGIASWTGDLVRYGIAIFIEVLVCRSRRFLWGFGCKGKEKVDSGGQ